MKLKNLVLVAFVILFDSLYSQSDFRPGYILELSGDTLYGEINYRGDLTMKGTCKFKNSENLTTGYSPDDILGFRLIDSKYYLSKEINSQKFFLECLIKGQVNIYYLRDNLGDHYYIDKEGEELIEIPYEEGDRIIDQKRVFYVSTKHIGVLRYYMQDAPNMESRIQALKKPEHKSLIALAEDYHNTVCKDEACIIYEKRLPVVKLYLEGIGGLVKFNNIESLADQFYTQYGVIAHLWVPRINEKFYIRTGFISSTAEFNFQKVVTKIPVQFEYIAPRGFVRPKLAVGLNFYRDFPLFSTVAFMGGVNFRIHKSVNIGFTYDVDFKHNETISILPSTLSSQAFLAGVTIKI